MNDMSLNYKKISEFVGVGVEKKLFSGSELESESKKKFFSESEPGFGIKKCDSADH